MGTKRKKVERLTMDPLVLDSAEPEPSKDRNDREDNDIAALKPINSTDRSDNENYLKQAFLCLVRGDWKSAEEYCEQELIRNPNSADAYLGKLMAELHVTKEELLAKCATPFDKSENYIGIQRSGNQEVLARVNGYLRQIIERQKEKLYVEAKKIMDSAKTKEDYQRAEAIFGKIATYKDASKLQKECQKIIKHWGRTKKPVDWKVVFICALIVSVIAGLVVAGVQLYPVLKELWTKPPVVDVTEPTTDPPVTTTMPVETTTESPILASGICGAAGNENNVTWVLERDGTFTVSGIGAMELNMLSKDKSSIKSIVIGEGVTSISRNAFRDCPNLTSVIMPSSVKTIEYCAFRGCTLLASVVIPPAVTEIGESAFESCTRLEHLTISDGLVTIGQKAFYGCSSLTELKIPDSIESIGLSAFGNCTKLRKISFPEKYVSIGRRIFEKTAWYDEQPYGCVYLGPVLYAYKGQYAIPMDREEDVVVKSGTKEILDSVFWGARIHSITFPESVEKIGDSSFYGCSMLTSVTIPEGVISIGDRAFDECESLTDVTIAASVENIGKNAFPLNVTIYGDVGSYAEKWAEENRVTFVPKDIPFTIPETLSELVTDPTEQDYYAYDPWYDWDEDSSWEIDFFD